MIRSHCMLLDVMRRTWMKLLRMLMALEEMVVSGCTCFSTAHIPPCWHQLQVEMLNAAIEPRKRGLLRRVQVHTFVDVELPPAWRHSISKLTIPVDICAEEKTPNNNKIYNR